MAATSLRGGFAALTQSMLPASPEALYKIVSSLGELKGVPMKMGQLLGYVDGSMPEHAQTTMAALHTAAQPLELARIAAILRYELRGNADALIDKLDPQPIGGGSIGQVHRARLPDGTDVAVKIQYPGVMKAIEKDFGPASLAGKTGAMLFPALRIARFVQEARERLLDECDYLAEARHIEALGKLYANHPVIEIPPVHREFSSMRVLTTTFAPGLYLEDYLATNPSHEDRDRFGEALFDFYVGTLLDHQLLPGDPHPGNYVFMTGGKLAIIDHGCTRAFGADGDRLARVTLALEAESRARVYDAVSNLGGEALLLLRIRYGLAAVLARLGMRASWRELIIRRGIVPEPAPVELEVVLVAPGDRVIELVREVREAFGLGISEAKALIDRAPHPLKRTHDRVEAEALKRRLEGSGGTVEIRALS